MTDPVLRRPALLAAGLATLVAAACHSGPPIVPASVLGGVGDAIEAAIDSGEIAGAVVQVRHRGETVLFDAYGQADIERDVDMSRRHAFQIASMTKPVVSVAALALVDAGLLDLRTPLAAWIPAFADTRVATGLAPDGTVTTVPQARPLLVGHLMSHTSGIAYPSTSVPGVRQAMEREGVTHLLEDPGISLGAFVERVARVPLCHQPGEQWTYGLGHDVLGRVLELADGRPLAEILKVRVFEPLRMEHTAFHAGPDFGRRIAQRYRRTGAGLVPAPLAIPDAPPSCPSGGAGLISTTQDYARFAEMLRCGGQLDGVEVLKLDTVRALIRDQIPGLTVWDQEAVGYGLGVGMLRAMDGGGWAGEPRAFHWSGVHGTGFFVDLDMELTVVLMTQAQPRARELEREVRSIVVRTVRGY